MRGRRQSDKSLKPIVVTLDDGSDVVLEAELAEPAFFFDIDPGAADRFAGVLAGRLGAAPG